MAIKSRNISSSPWLKLLAVMLAVSGLLLACYGTLEAPNFQYAVLSVSFANNGMKMDVLHEIYNVVDTIARIYRSEDYITSGNSSSAELGTYKNELQDAQNDWLRNINESYAAWIDSANQGGQTSEVARLTAERDTLVAQDRESVNQQVAERRAQLIEKHLASYQNMMAKLAEPNAYRYYAVINGGGSLANTGNVADVAAYFSALPASAGGKLGGGSIVYAGISEEKYALLEGQFQQNRAKGLAGGYEVLAGLAIFLLGFGYVLYSAGNRPDTNEISILTSDRLYLDIGLCILAAAVTPCSLLIGQLWDLYRHTGSQMPLVLGAVLTTIVALLILTYGSIVAKRVKRREFLRHTLLYVTLAWLYKTIRHFWQGTLRALRQSGPLPLRLAGLLIAYTAGATISLLLMTTSRDVLAVLIGFCLLVAINGGAFIFVQRKWAVLKMIARGAERIKNGELSYRIPEDANSELAAIAMNVNNIAAGLEVAVDREVKAERLKAELITNVSHDLKTPLTSLITYIDLLKTEGLTSESALKYLDVLDKKSQRLKTLTDDLFEAAKAASGNLSLNLERLDVGSLLTQGLAELSERIEESGLDFRVSIPPERLFVLADGKRLWRVLENLVSNVVKYALPGSRVYVQVTSQSDQVALIFKNISAAPLNLNPDELLERFKRGDESRHSEGSGLGLAIAKSLVDLQGGRFKIEVDGDLFKATVSLPRCN